MFADYNYYTNKFGGTMIQDDTEYKRFGQQSSRYIINFAPRICKDNEDAKMCECAISEKLYTFNTRGNITSESVPNFYSVSYGSNDIKSLNREIQDLLELYLGNKYSSVGACRVIN